MGAFQPMYLALVALVALLVFGPKKLPELRNSVRGDDQLPPSARA